MNGAETTMGIATIQTLSHFHNVTLLGTAEEADSQTGIISPVPGHIGPWKAAR